MKYMVGVEVDTTGLDNLFGQSHDSWEYEAASPNYSRVAGYWVRKRCIDVPFMCNVEWIAPDTLLVEESDVISDVTTKISKLTIETASVESSGTLQGVDSIFQVVRRGIIFRGPTPPPLNREPLKRSIQFKHRIQLQHDSSIRNKKYAQYYK